MKHGLASMPAGQTIQTCLIVLTLCVCIPTPLALDWGSGSMNSAWLGPCDMTSHGREGGYTSLSTFINIYFPYSPRHNSWIWKKKKKKK